MEGRDILFVAVSVLFAVSMTRAQDTPREGGPNICQTMMMEEVSVTVTYNEPYTYRTTTWCLAFPPRCSQYFTKYRLSQRVEQRKIYKTIRKCCGGYQNVNGNCLAQCYNDCNNQGVCVAPGICKCSPGFKGTNCESICAEGTWGPNCDRHCNCSGHGSCSTLDGRCICAAGYTGENCQTICHNSFGMNCQIPCACQNGAACDPVTGACTCAPGFYGPLCHQICPPGTHGNSCQNTCICQNGGQCHPVTGTCNCSQVFGYTGAYCNEPCPDNKWGFNCNSTCPVCYNGNCNKSKGKCECYFGYGGDNCQIQCQLGRYGDNCQIQCPCQNGGFCYQTPGGGGIACNCSAGYIGKDCTQRCPCDNDARCYYTNTGIIGCDCPSGFIGDKCNIRVCPPNKYGLSCEHECQCVQNSTQLCHPQTGHCFCKLGWQGIYCNQPCSFPYYGENCAKVCDCLNNGNCDHITGQCECQPGYKGVRCQERCDEGTFGVKCQEKCYCKNGAHCDASNGRCSCTVGWNGTFCESSCVGFYGLDCASQCMCSLETSVCDPFDGTCRCKSGYTGKYCTEQCSAWRFGIQCTQLCSSYCDQNNSLGCHHVTGECICMPGWSGMNCKSNCPKNMWGLNCLNTCNCKNDGTCDSRTGVCICPPGYQGTLCEQECDGNMYGKDCALQCPECKQNEHCNPVTGVCQLTRCPPGYTGINCQLTCPANTYGQNCTGICSNDCDSTKAYCDAVTGECICYPGFYGTNCRYSCPINKYGQNCKYDCACENGVCRPYDGHCHCNAGYTGVMCSQSCPPRMYGILCNQTCHCTDMEYCSPVHGCILISSASQQIKESEISTSGVSYVPVIIGIAAAALVLFILLIIIVLYFRRKVKHLKHQNSAIISFSKGRNNITISNDVHDMFGVVNPTYEQVVEDTKNSPQAAHHGSCCQNIADPEEERYSTLKSLNGVVAGMKDCRLSSNYTKETHEKKLTEKRMFYPDSRESSSENGTCGVSTCISSCESLPAGKTPLHGENMSLYATMQRPAITTGQQSIVPTMQFSLNAVDQTSSMATEKSESSTSKSRLPEMENPGICDNLIRNVINEGASSILHDTHKSVLNKRKGLYSTLSSPCVPVISACSSQNSQDSIVMETTNHGEDDNIINISLEKAAADLESFSISSNVKHAYKPNSQGQNKRPDYDIYEKNNHLHTAIDDQQQPVINLINFSEDIEPYENRLSSNA